MTCEPCQSGKLGNVPPVKPIELRIKVDSIDKIVSVKVTRRGVTRINVSVKDASDNENLQTLLVHPSIPEIVMSISPQDLEIFNSIPNWWDDIFTAIVLNDKIPKSEDFGVINLHHEKSQDMRFEFALPNTIGIFNRTMVDFVTPTTIIGVVPTNDLMFSDKLISFSVNKRNILLSINEDYYNKLTNEMEFNIDELIDRMASRAITGQ